MMRCGWDGNDPLMISYHDEEWGVPVRDDRKLFEFLVLEGAQAGLSWRTVLRKREGYRRAFHGFDPEGVARYGDTDVARLLSDPGIIRNRAKVESAISNARLVVDVQAEFGSFGTYLWGFVGNRPIVNRFRTMSELPARSRESDVISRDMVRRGFRFVGPTICYAFLQAVGMVNDHLVTCFRHAAVQGKPRR
ncbi:MAG: DNA-3-methyladenine glycosylase I [Candidatus Deferrimicrobiaceae bacterium]